MLDAAESALEAWNASPHDSSQAAALRRPLHTLKGGARMAGVVAMGELSHELESLITRIEHGLASADDSARNLAQQALDELAKMRDTIAEGRPAAQRTGFDCAHSVGSRSESCRGREPTGCSEHRRSPLRGCSRQRTDAGRRESRNHDR